MADTNPAPLEPKSPIAPDLDAGTRQALDRIKEAISRGLGDKAIRLFKEASLHGLIPNDDDASVVAWLQHSLGPGATGGLIAAYAELSCFYCQGGLMPCADCDGRGHEVDDAPCSKCLALGVDRCDFCGGSGWFAINHVPTALQVRVIMRRVLTAATQAQAALGLEIPRLADTASATVRTVAAKALLQVSCLSGVLENMAVAARQFDEGPAESVEIARKAVAACEALAPKLHDRACRLLGVLAEVAAAEGALATQKGTRSSAEQRAQYYGELASSGDFSGTLLRRPDLFSNT